MAQERGVRTSLDADGLDPDGNHAHLQELSARRFAMARILVIDDYEPFRASVKELLEANGYDVAVAVDGEDGIRQFELHL
jgi:PleD family two-component response regulator